jgi:hypothetical protein
VPSSKSYTFTSVGTFYFVATYKGDTRTRSRARPQACARPSRSR